MCLEGNHICECPSHQKGRTLDLIIMTILPITKENVPFSFTLHFHLPICSTKCSLMFKLKMITCKLKSTQELNRLVLSFSFWLMNKGDCCGWFYNPSSNLLSSSFTHLIQLATTTLWVNVCYVMCDFMNKTGTTYYIFKIYHLRFLFFLNSSRNHIQLVWTSKWIKMNIQLIHNYPLL